MKCTTWLIPILLLTSAGKAQFGNDPREKIREKLAEISKGMQTVDDGLRKAGPNTVNELRKNSKRLDELMKMITGSQQKVVKDIEELLQQMHKMQQQSKQQSQSQSQSGQSKPDQDSGKQQQQQQQKGKQRKPGQRPEQEKGGKQQKGKQQSQPISSQQDEGRGEKSVGAKPPAAETARIKQERKNSAWGKLPPYLLKHRRGSTPQVPEKYRKYLEALMKQKK